MRNVQRTETSKLRDERGVALVTVLLLALALSAIVAASVTVSGNNELIHRYHDRHSLLTALADGGLEEARALINGTDLEVPEDDYVTVEDGEPVTDASGDVVPGVERSIWVGPRGESSGQFGTFASIVVEVEDGHGNRVIRRQTLEQESFAKFAYFTDFEPGDIRFGDGDAILGPLHTNSDVRIWSCCAVFHGEVTTAGQVTQPSYGDFRQDYEENVEPIEMPETEELDKLEDQAQKGNTAFTGTTTGDVDEATTRIEFVAEDIDGDGEIRPSEGFIRVYRVTDPGDADYVTAGYDYSSDVENSPNCGHDEDDGSFVTAADHPHDGHEWHEVDDDSDARCFLGGDPALNGGTFDDDVGPGEWLEWPGSVDSEVAAARADADYLFPLGHELNPNFKGVIYVDGDVAVSGKLRGRVTVAATGDIVLADDLTYVTPPGAPDRSCRNDDLMGLFAGENVVVADNAMNAAVRTRQESWGGGTTEGPYHTYDGGDDPYREDEHFHGVVLALDQFLVANHDEGATDHEDCEGQSWGRGCLYLTGGVIQESRGPVGLSSGTGYLKRYDYDACAAELPPPYFPTTGRFKKNLYYQIDPKGFDVEEFFEETS
ncbi:MAG: hypothetical protein ACOC83_08095 [Gemmatimonadota bacterium]